jgi:hypothetical protein
MSPFSHHHFPFNPTPQIFYDLVRQINKTEPTSGKAKNKKGGCVLL